MTDPTGGPAFPRPYSKDDYGDYPQAVEAQSGMTLHQYFVGQALANPAICNGDAPEWQLRAWFGETAMGITSSRITARQAVQAADSALAMLQARTKESGHDD